MQGSNHNTSEILCQHCGRRIASSNYLIHEARCQMMSSRVRRDQPKKQQEKHPQIRHSQPAKHEQNKGHGSQRRQVEGERKKIFNEPLKKQEEERIPCTYCGYMQTLLQLDTHPNECPFSGKPCTFCGQSFPESLMGEHQQVCSARVPPQHQNHIHHEQPNHQFPESYQIQSDEEDERYDYHPFGNLFFFGNNRPNARNNGPQPVFRTIQRVNGRTIIEESDGRGGIIRRQSFDREGQPTFRQLGRQEFFGSRRNGSPFGDFFRLLELMALRSGQAEQGLTKEELKALTKIKYKPSSTAGEKDLCTICYCQFEQNERIIQLKCKHMYHEQCIIKWLEKNAKCPVCKTPQTNRPINREE